MSEIVKEIKVGLVKGKFYPDRRNPSRCQRQFEKDADINVIVDRYLKKGQLPPITKVRPVFGDFSKVDFQESLDVVMNAKEMFEALPSKVRERFYNDPGNMVSFMSDKNNREEAEKLGLIKPKVEKKDGQAGRSGEVPPKPSDAPKGASGGDK